MEYIRLMDIQEGFPSKSLDLTIPVLQMQKLFGAQVKVMQVSVMTVVEFSILTSLYKNSVKLKH